MYGNHWICWNPQEIVETKSGICHGRYIYIAILIHLYHALDMTVWRFWKWGVASKFGYPEGFSSTRPGKLTVCYWKRPSRNSWFTHKKTWWFSIIDSGFTCQSPVVWHLPGSSRLHLLLRGGPLCQHTGLWCSAEIRKNIRDLEFI